MQYLTAEILEFANMQIVTTKSRRLTTTAFGWHQEQQSAAQAARRVFIAQGET